jgi:lipid II:glycine glycyltransferase (peptidoglycan interpeptide bridge formation enzyme)
MSEDPANVASPAWTVASWDAHVRAHPQATYLQTSAWTTVKLANGWSSTLVVGSSPAAGVIGAQILVQPLPVLPWRFAYAPRGPLADRWTGGVLDAWTARLRSRPAGLRGVAMVRMDPEVETGATLDGGPEVAAELARLGWRQAPDAQPRRTRIIDLRADEAALWSDLRKKWRQYVNRARTSGVAIRDVDPAVETDAWAIFHRVMRETGLRAGVPIRAESAYEELWAAFQPTGESRLLFAADASGATLAVLLLVRCGGRVVEPYGGMTEAGATLRANYLLKWEAIRSSREQGATSYDLWGLVHPGIAHFKQGFGGQEMEYIGAWDLALSPLGAMALRVGETARGPVLRALRGLRRRPGPSQAAETAAEEPDASGREAGEPEAEPPAAGNELDAG